MNNWMIYIKTHWIVVILYISCEANSSRKPCPCKDMAMAGVLVRSMVANGLGVLFVKMCKRLKRMQENSMKR